MTAAAATPIAERVHVVLTDDATAAADASRALDDLREALSEANVAWGKAKEKALDPLSAPAAAQKARAEMERLGFEVDRLKAAETSMAARLELLRSREAKAVAAGNYAAAKAERDALAAELADRWPKLCDEAVSLLRRLKASDERIAATRSGGDEWLHSAEVVARGCEGAFGTSLNHATPLGQSKIVKFDPKPTADDYGLAWPLPQQRFRF